MCHASLSTLAFAQVSVVINPIWSLLTVCVLRLFSLLPLSLLSWMQVLYPRNMQAVSAAHFWRLGQQVSSSQAPAGWTTAFDNKLFVIRLDITKITSMNIEHVILITDSPSSARKTVGFSVHSGQTHSFTISFILRLFFSYSPNYRIKFWDCLSNAEWFLYQLVYDDITNTKVAARLHSTTSIDVLCFKSIFLYLDVWKIFFNYPTI